MGIQLFVLILFFWIWKKEPDIFVGILSEQPTSDADLYRMLEDMCKNNSGEKYDECSRAPLCGKDNLSWQDKKAALESFDVGGPNYQSCYKDACEGLAVPLCCYAIAATGDPAKCPGYAERLWCPKEHCERIDSEKGRACNDGNPGSCNCGHAYNHYCAEEGEDQAPPISLCERLKLEGISSVVCVTNEQPTPTPTPATGGDPKPKCEAFNFKDVNGGTLTSQQRVNSTQKINIEAKGTDNGVRPSKLHICWTLADQSTDFYKTGTNFACEFINEPTQGETANSAVAKIENQTISYFSSKLTNVTESQIKDYGLIFVLNVYSGNNPNIFCSTNPGFNNGLGVILDISTQDVTNRYTNSTCGLGSVANQADVSCSLKLKYDPTGQNVNAFYDLNEDGKVNISDFTLFVGYYKNKDLKIDYDGNKTVGIEDFVKFKDEYVKEQINN